MKAYLIATVLAVGLMGVGCNQSVESASEDFNSLPTQVQKAVRAHAPQAEVASVSHDTQNGRDVYNVEFRDPGLNPSITVSADGQVLNAGGTESPNGLLDKAGRALTPTGAVGTKFSALPAAVQSAIQSHAPNMQISDIERHEDNGRVIYEIQFKDQGTNPNLKIAEDGTVVQELQK